MKPLAAVNLETTTAQYEFIMEMLTRAKYSHPPQYISVQRVYLKLASKFILFCQQAGAGQSDFVARYPLCLRV